MRRTDDEGIYGLENSYNLHNVCAAIVVLALESQPTRSTLCAAVISWGHFLFPSAAQCVRAGWDKTPSLSNKPFAFSSCRPTVCVTRAGAGRRDAVRPGKC
ncbi:MAG: hypothetical protein IPP54_20210 [Anaerolineales bacterium]|nr:hypothetical protein [Anaerolineales bacterium]